MGALVWFVTALILAGLELLAGEFTFLMLAAAALITAGFAFADIPIWLEAVVFGASALMLVFFLRPLLKRNLDKPAALDTSPNALIGRMAEVLEIVDGRRGQIRLDGDVWSARSLDPASTFQPGKQVSVTSFDGPTAVVWRD